MNRLNNLFSAYLTVILLITGLAVSTNAQRNRNNRDVRDTVRSLSSKIYDFQNSLSGEFRNNNNRRDRTDLEDYLRKMDNEVRDFEAQYNRQSENADDVSAILDEAKKADALISRLSFSQKTYDQWTEIRTLLGTLAGNYNVYWNAGNDNRNYPTSRNNRNNYPDNRNNNYPNRGNQNYYGDNNLTGTYRLDTSRSEDTNQILNNNRVRDNNSREDLRQKLDAPPELAISVRGNQVTLASSNASPATFDANGQTISQTASNGKNISVRISLQDNNLTVSSFGNSDSDYTVTFSSIENGKALKVTRRITTDYLRQTVFAESIYSKTDEVARLGINNGNYNNSDDGGYSSSDDGYRNNRYPNGGNYPNSGNSPYPRSNGGRSGKFIVPDGMIITGTLDNNINTKDSQNNDRFTMTVNAPNQYRGAVVEGYLSGIDRSGKVSGRSEITFNFVNIRLRNGQTYDFAGNLQTITDLNGDTIKIGDESEAKSGSQTKETIKRGGIGAGLGAIIGAIAGGGKGAAIGAIIGGGAGAGSVILTGKEELDIKQGSTVSVESSSPIR